MITTAAVTVQATCNTCGHNQTVNVINARIIGDVLIDGYMGSSADFCDHCDGPVELGAYQYADATAQGNY